MIHLRNHAVEKAILGAILLDNQAIEHTRDLKADYFHHKPCRLIFASMVELEARGVAIDAITLAGELQCCGDLDRVGGVAYLATLMDGLPRRVEVEAWALSTKNLAERRRLIEIAERVIKGAEDGDSVDEVIDACMLEFAMKNGECSCRGGGKTVQK